MFIDFFTTECVKQFNIWTGLGLKASLGDDNEWYRSANLIYKGNRHQTTSKYYAAVGFVSPIWKCLVSRFWKVETESDFTAESDTEIWSKQLIQLQKWRKVLTMYVTAMTWITLASLDKVEDCWVIKTHVTKLRYSS